MFGKDKLQINQYINTKKIYKLIVMTLGFKNMHKFSS